MTAGVDAIQHLRTPETISVQPRGDRQVLEGIAELLVENLAAIKHLTARMADANDARSSVEIKTSTRGVDVTCKAYAGSSIVDAESAAVCSYFRVLADVQERINASVENGRGDAWKEVRKA